MSNFRNNGFEDHQGQMLSPAPPAKRKRQESGYGSATSVPCSPLGMQSPYGNGGLYSPATPGPSSPFFGRGSPAPKSPRFAASPRQTNYYTYSGSEAESEAEDSSFQRTDWFNQDIQVQPALTATLNSNFQSSVSPPQNINNYQSAYENGNTNNIQAPAAQQYIPARYTSNNEKGFTTYAAFSNNNTGVSSGFSGPQVNNVFFPNQPIIQKQGFNVSPAQQQVIPFGQQQQINDVGPEWNHVFDMIENKCDLPSEVLVDGVNLDGFVIPKSVWKAAYKERKNNTKAAEVLFEHLFTRWEIMNCTMKGVKVNGKIEQKLCETRRFAVIRGAMWLESLKDGEDYMLFDYRQHEVSIDKDKKSVLEKAIFSQRRNQLANKYRKKDVKLNNQHIILPVEAFQSVNGQFLPNMGGQGNYC